MVHLNKKLHLFLWVVLCFFSDITFAVRITYVLVSDPTFNLIDCELLPHPDTSGKLKKESDPVFLRIVFDDGPPDSTLFASGEGLSCVTTVNPSTIFQTGVVRKDSFEEDYMHVLGRNGFAFNSVDYFALLRKMEKSDIDHDLNGIRTSARNLQAEYRQRCEFLTEAQARTFDTKRQIEHLAAMGRLQTQYCEYLVHMVRAGTPLSNWLSIKEYCDRTYPGKEEEKVSGILRAIEKEFQERKKILIEVTKILPPEVVRVTAPSIEGAPVVETDRDAHVKLFLQNWGKHAEDALILQVIDNVRKFGKIPKKITIYGTKDPCFHCQMKLQWLADLLRKRIVGADLNQFIQTADASPEVEICYYSKKEFESECVMMQVPTAQKSRHYTTRTMQELNGIKKFSFVSNKPPDEKEMECFNIYTIDLNQKDLNPIFSILSPAILTSRTYIKVELANFDKTSDESLDKLRVCLDQIRTWVAGNPSRISVGVFAISKTGVVERQELIQM